MYIQCQVFLIKKEEKPTKYFLTVRTRPRPHNCFQRTTGEFEGVLQTPLMPCPAVCCKVSEAVCPYNGKSDTGTGKLCFSVSVGVAYGTGQIVTVKGERVEISNGNTTRTLTGSKRNGTAVASPSSCISYKTKTIINYRGKPHTQLLSVSESPSISPLPLSWKTGRKYCNSLVGADINVRYSFAVPSIIGELKK